jgi:hypothetical protein
MLYLVLHFFYLRRCWLKNPCKDCWTKTQENLTPFIFNHFQIDRGKSGYNILSKIRLTICVLTTCVNASGRA